MSTKISLKSVTAAKKIDSPLAKYNSTGQLFCVLCNIQIKNEMYWTGHVNGKAHREKGKELKRGGASAATTSSQKRPASSNSNGNSKISSDESEAKKSKMEIDSRLMGPPLSIPPAKMLPKKTYKEIEYEEALMEIDSDINNSKALANITLENDVGGEEIATVENNADVVTSSSSSTSLPEGFFDDAKEDAKARGIDYRNPEEAEWERFVKEMATEDIKSTALRTADEEDSASNRELDEIEEQMKNWQRVMELEKKVLKQQLERQKMEGISQNDEEEDEEIDYDEDLDWRSKAKK